jgi:hypothetical protein
MSMLRAGSVFLFLGLAGCAGPDIPEVVSGEWGGVHLGLVTTAAGADLEYDCAEGRITGAVRPDANGRFAAVGVHFPGHGGPIRIDETRESRPARYDGTVRGDTMIITVTLTDSNEVLGSFTLIHGASPHVFKCL